MSWWNGEHGGKDVTTDVVLTACLNHERGAFSLSEECGDQRCWGGPQSGVGRGEGKAERRGFRNPCQESVGGLVGSVAQGLSQAAVQGSGYSHVKVWRGKDHFQAYSRGGCGQGSVPHGLLDEGFSSMLAAGRRLPSVPWHVGLSIRQLTASSEGASRGR